MRRGRRVAHRHGRAAGGEHAEIAAGVAEADQVVGRHTQVADQPFDRSPLVDAELAELAELISDYLRSYGLDVTVIDRAQIEQSGASFGLQAGVQSADVILVFRNDRSLDNIVNGKFTLGADAGVAAGPVGRSAAAATDGQLKAEIWSWSRARGLFAGVALDGAGEPEWPCLISIAPCGAPNFLNLLIRERLAGWCWTCVERCRVVFN